MVPNVPPYIKTTDFKLRYGSDFIVISRRPSFSDSIELFKNRVFHDQNDFLISFRAPNWPEYNSISFEILGITKIEAEAVETFMINHVGLIIQMTINNQKFDGIITNSNMEFVDEKNDDCNFKIAFTFETEGRII